ncbi:putative alpha-glucosidase [CHAIN 0] [Phytophthora infestans]|uniref:Putative alpha-glucosidase [CHAIN 0] n=1 Tax=Phytophthora infestans TaxID=4787 RepID=A0A833W0Y4_PHYIN|nr:putative alpha-glucosidase [CHAIN 0] [Phytophthora infestans]KAF4139805.1 putative alpha-glucosidase [CHAIN 0] [Phytophthora infestans]
MPVHMRGGTILAMHQPALTTTSARLTPFDILVALSYTGDASGELFLDDGETINPNATIVSFTASVGMFKCTAVQNHYVDAHTSLVNKVIVLGVTSSPSRVSLGFISNYDSDTQRLEIDLTSANQTIDTDFSIIWE